MRCGPDKILEAKVTTVRSKVKSRPHHDVAHLHPLMNVLIKYQLLTPYGFEIQPKHYFKVQGHNGKVKHQINPTS